MDVDQVVRGLLALVFVLGLIGGIALLAKRFGFTPRVTLPRGGSSTARKNNKGRRLGIVEVLPVDAKRRLILIRRDDTEHLVLLGADRDMVVESGVPAPVSPDGNFTEVNPSMRDPLRRGKGPGGQYDVA